MKDQHQVAANTDSRSVCGIVMPISAIDGCDERHWGEVLAIISDSVEASGFKPNIVSNADDVGIIQKRIIQNLYENPIVICDVSGKNPNVMFELGIRLAFDKPTIVIKDDQISYSFDTSPIEHIEYPRDLRFSKIVDFKDGLTKKINATYQASQKPGYTTFLKNFGEFKVAKIDEREVSQAEFLNEEISDIKMMINRLMRDQSQRPGSMFSRSRSSSRTDICLENFSDSDIMAFVDRAEHHAGVFSVDMNRVGDHFHVRFVKRLDWPQTIDEIRADLMKEIKAMTGRDAKDHSEGNKIK